MRYSKWAEYFGWSKRGQDFYLFVKGCGPVLKGGGNFWGPNFLGVPKRGCKIFWGTQRGPEIIDNCPPQTDAPLPVKMIAPSVNMVKGTSDISQRGFEFYMTLIRT